MINSTQPLPTTTPAPPTRQLAHSAFHLIMGQAGTTVLAILLTGCIGRALGPSDFGIWYVLTTVAGLACVLVDWGYSPYIIREVARHPERAGELTGTLLAVRAATTVLVCGPAFLATWVLGYGARMRWFTLLLMAASLPTLLLTSLTWTFRARERMDFEAWTNVIAKVLTLGLTYALLRTGLKLSAVIAAQGLAGAVTLVWAFRLYYRLQVPALRFSAPVARELVREAAPMFTMGLMVSLQPYIDATMLSRLATAEAVGWYGATAVFTGTLMAPAIILGSAAYPRLSRVADKPEQFAALVRSTLRPMLFLAALGAVGTYLFADFAVATVYHNAAFRPAATILRFFAGNLFLVSVDVLLAYCILAAGRIKLLARAKIAAVAVTACLEPILIPWAQARLGNGGAGVTLSFAAGEIVLIAVAIRLMPAGTLGRHAAQNMARAVAAALVVLGLMRLAAFTPLLAIPLTIVAFTAVSFALGLLTRDDIEALLTLLGRKYRAVPTVTMTTAA